VNAYPWCPRSNAVNSTNTTLCTSSQLEENWAVLRHSAATSMIRDGEDIVTVAEILGHSVETAPPLQRPPTQQDKKSTAIRRIPPVTSSTTPN
jgi:hypothetical protein